MKTFIISILALFLVGAIVGGFIFHDKYRDIESKLHQSNENVSSLNDRIDQLTAENSKLYDQINKNIELDKKVTDLNNELKIATERNSQLENQLKDETEKITSLNKDILSLKDKTLKLQAQIQGEKSLEEEISRLQEDLGQEREAAISKEREASVLKDKISKLQAQIQGEKSLAQNKIKELKSVSKSLIAELEKQLKNKEMTIKEFKEKLTITLVDSLLFDFGKATITTEGREVLDKVINIVRNIHDMQIWIVGHTDNVPIKEEYLYKFPSNWELSAARASAVANYFQKNNNIDPKDLTVIGRSFYEPVATNNTAEGRAKNRRVEIVIAPKLME